jgi:hypothetical protein
MNRLFLIIGNNIDLKSPCELALALWQMQLK